ncbi:YgcG family protein [Cupriavidus necator H16]|uniref:YgcG family protein n=1 Tax=Cupriavidus necator (strain ATCC 17699 / DSM 428 / KCTC 22496 / NCIMB 10442 / H16 / Stanier 337) TaxID=381666 RepID=A0AAE5ZEB9_CUPNH|nr:YgcG family protein [Cupriavidus necator]QCB99809.1 YgcG family protein [Cupriavidus necator H16]
MGHTPRSPWRHAWLAAALLWLAALLAGPALAADGFVAVPPLTQRVTDLTGTLTPQQRGALENVLAEYEQQRGSQIFVLMVPTTDPEPIDAYSIRVADAWRAGRKGIDDGVIVLIAKDNPPGLRKMRLEVGRGVQGSLTDAMSRRILQDVMAPHFRQNDFYGGLAAGISAIQATIDKEGLAAPQRKAQQSSALAEWLPALLPLAIIVFFFLSAILRRRGPQIVTTRRGRDVIAGGLGGLGGYTMGQDWRRRGGGGGGGGFGGGGDSGGGFGGGGGGGFDGGGASGNW